MSRFASACLVAGLISASAAGTAMAADAPADKYAWLEDVTGDKPLSSEPAAPEEDPLVESEQEQIVAEKRG